MLNYKSTHIILSTSLTNIFIIKAIYLINYITGYTAIIINYLLH